MRIQHMNVVVSLLFSCIYIRTFLDHIHTYEERERERKRVCVCEKGHAHTTFFFFFFFLRFSFFTPRRLVVVSVVVGT